MKISGIIWLKDVVDKLLAKHQVTTEEVEQVFANRPRFEFVTRGRYQGEDVYAALGRTDAGRYLFVLFVYKATHEVLILSARDMDRKERRRYAKGQKTT